MNQIDYRHRLFVQAHELDDRLFAKMAHEDGYSAKIDRIWQKANRRRQRRFLAWVKSTIAELFA